MSDMTLFAGGIPAHLKNAQLDETTKALMGQQSSGGSGGGKRISIKAGVFRMIVDGKEIAQNEDRGMNVVIVAAAANNSRVFYAKSFEEGQQAAAPDCWSNDGITPSAKAKNKQASRCLECPQNIKGSSGRGTSRACKFNRHIAVVLENDQKGEIFQVTVPSNSLWDADNGKLGIQPYAEFLGGHGIGITQVVTEMRFDTASSSPKLHFKAVKPLTPEEIAFIQSRAKHPDALKAIGNTAGEIDTAKPVAIAAPEPKVEQPVFKEPTVKEPTKREKEKPAEAKDVSSILDDWAA